MIWNRASLVFFFASTEFRWNASNRINVFAKFVFLDILSTWHFAAGIGDRWEYIRHVWIISINYHQASGESLEIMKTFSKDIKNLLNIFIKKFVNKLDFEVENYC